MDAAGYSVSRVIKAFKATARELGYRYCEVRDYTCEESDQYEVLYNGQLRRGRATATLKKAA